MPLNLAFRNELESLKEKMAKKGEEIKSKLDEREANVCDSMCFIIKIYNITRRTKSKCKNFFRKALRGGVISYRGYFSVLLPVESTYVHMLSLFILKDKDLQWDVDSLHGGLKVQICYISGKQRTPFSYFCIPT